MTVLPVLTPTGQSRTAAFRSRKPADRTKGPAGLYAKCVAVQVSQNRDRMLDLSAERAAHQSAVDRPRVVKYDEPSSLTTSLSNVTQGPGLVRKRIKRIEQVRKIKRIANQSRRAGHIVFLQCSSAILPSSPRKHADG